MCLFSFLKMEDTIANLYLDPAFPGSLSSAPTFYRALKREKKLQGITFKQLKNILSKINAYSLYKHPYRPKRSTAHAQVVTSGSNQQWQIDLIEFLTQHAHQNKGHRFLMVAIDVFSKRAFAYPLKNKGGEAVAEGLKEMFSEAPKIPRKVQTDAGKEFYNKHVQELFKKHHVRHFTSQNTEKAQIVERLNRTLKERINKYFQHRNNKKWIDIYKPIVQSYNKSNHSAIGRAPVDVTRETEGLTRGKLYYGEGRIYKPQLPLLKDRKNMTITKGAYVRLLKAKRTFEKGYTRRWTTEVFQISEVLSREQPTRYKVVDLKGEDVIGSFYANELQVIPPPEEYSVKVERVNKSKREALISFNNINVEPSWVPLARLRKIGRGNWKYKIDYSQSISNT